MDFEKILAQLRGERDLIEQVIVNIEKLAHKVKRGRGRPLGSITKSQQNGTRPAPALAPGTLQTQVPPLRTLREPNQTRSSLPIRTA
jgi:hypothetical protein